MKIAVSSNDNAGLESTVSGHFGHCPFFTIVNVDDKKIGNVQSLENPFAQGHQPFEIPAFLQSQGVQVIMSGGMGGRAIDFFKQNGIEVITGCAGKVQESIENYLAGNISAAEPCHESVEHHHGHA
jgi:predicted Fe-Mo cluster-binding NifX family protein